MSKFYKVKIGAVYLTDNGLQTGLPCKLAVAGADALLSPFTGSVTPAVDGTPIMQIFETNLKGKVLEIRVFSLTTAVWNSLLALINTALAANTTINLTATGDIGNFDVQVLPLVPKPFEASEFSNSRIKNSTFRFITT